MKTKEIVDLMLKSSSKNPYTGKLSKKDNIVAAIDLAKLARKFAEDGHVDEAMGIPVEDWDKVIAELHQMLLGQV